MSTPQGQRSDTRKHHLSQTTRARPTIRAFEPGLHGLWLQKLWKGAMHPRWSISDDVLQSVLVATKLALIAEQDGIPLGLGAVDYGSFGKAGLVFLIVDPAWQRQGIGTLIVEALEAQLRAMQISVLRLGAVSTATYLWTGMPFEADAAWPFFARKG